MSNGSVKSQGTALYLRMVDSGGASLVLMECPTGISGLGGAADQIDDTCLGDTVDRSFVRGLGNPGQVSVPFILKPMAISHQELFALKDLGDTLQWIALLSDGTSAPTLNSNEDIQPPADRTSFMFNAYIADVNIDIASNDVVKGTLTLQRSGVVTPTWKA
jgi:hypothetical protein